MRDLLILLCVASCLTLWRAYELVPDRSPVNHLHLSDTAAPGKVNTATTSSLSSFSETHDTLISYIKDSLQIDEEQAAARAVRIWKNDPHSLDWMTNRRLLETISAQQKAFLASPDSFQPRPLLYRPILKGMGWGNLLYDICNHAVMAAMLDRPFLMMLDRKDSTGKLGWKEGVAETFLHPHPEYDWRWHSGKLVELFPKSMFGGGGPAPNYIKLTCREGYGLFDQCGGNQAKGSFESLMATFRRASDLPLYSEYSASFIEPLSNAKSYRNWIRNNLGEYQKDSHRVALMLRFGFNVMFQINSTFLRKEILPRLSNLTNGFTDSFYSSHVRTGHLELGVPRGGSSDVESVLDCRNQSDMGKQWLFLTDNAEVASKVSSVVTTTVHSDFSLRKYHVGISTGKDQAEAWRVALRDWVLLVQSSGPIFLRTRMPSAFSYGERGSFIGRMSCTSDRSQHPLLRCGGKFFDRVCTKT